MRTHMFCLAMAFILARCGSTRITNTVIDEVAATLDFGDYTSSTLTLNPWQASNQKDHAALLAYTRECVQRYQEEAKRMNAAMRGFASSSTAAEHWALNDVGISLFIMAHAYVELEMFTEAAEASQRLASDYTYAQCWEANSWFWRPADGAANKARDYRLQGQGAP